MKKTFKKLAALTLALCIALAATACGGTEQESYTLRLAYQYGLAYAPLTIVQSEKLIEEAFEEKTGKTVNVEWTQMNSGADINTAFAADSIDVGFLGAAVAITGVANEVGYKVFTNLSGQENSMMTNDSEIKSLKDLVGSNKQIAMVNLGSIQHIIMAMALDNAGLDAHALDENIVAMPHPDGMTALESGSVSCHLTSNPYIYQERESGKYTELTEVGAARSKDASFIVGVASQKLHDESPELYEAMCEAFASAQDMLTNDVEAAAEICAEFDGFSIEDEIKYLKVGSYKPETSQLYKMAEFMEKAKFIDKAPASYEDLVFDNVTGD